MALFPFPEHLFLMSFFFLLPIVYSGITIANGAVTAVVEFDAHASVLSWSSTGLQNLMQPSSFDSVA